MQKRTLHHHCIEQIESKIATLEQAIRDAQQAASDDTKSSAGDKFETSREMMKQEINKNSLQVTNLARMLQQLRQINPEVPRDKVEFGSLVVTNEGSYYFSVGLGKILLDGQTCFALSMASPIAKAMKDHRKGDTISFLGREIQITRIS